MKIITVFATFFMLSSFAQHNTEESRLYTLFDQTISIKNTNLSYGKLYTDNYRKLGDNHQFLKVNEFKKGEVTYQNQTYYNVLLKYDLLNDAIIVNLNSDFENRSIVLEKAYVNSFKLDGNLFINRENEGYLEVLHQSKSISFFKKNKKSKKKKLNESFLYYKFLEDDVYYVLLNDNLSIIKNKKTLIQLLPHQKKNISTYYKKEKSLRKTNKAAFYKQLSNLLQPKLKSI